MLDWGKNPPAPALPPAVVAKTQAKYLAAYEKLTRYDGPDEQLAKQCRFGNSLSVKQIAPILRAWGYSYDADKAP